MSTFEIVKTVDVKPGDEKPITQIALLLQEAKAADGWLHVEIRKPVSAKVPEWKKDGAYDIKITRASGVVEVETATLKDGQVLFTQSVELLQGDSVTFPTPAAMIESLKVSR